MTVSFSEFFGEIANSPMILTISILLVFMFVINGFTDSPNTIVTTVSTRAIGVDLAIMLSSVMNFFGVLSVGIFIPKVALTIANLAFFSSNNNFVYIAIFSVFFSMIIWVFISWKLGFPISESHSIIGALIGSSLALNRGIKGINFSELLKVLLGFLFSAFLGFIIGFLIVNLIKKIFKNHDRRVVKKPFNILNLVGSLLLSFMHGAHNGQKHVGLFLVVYLSATGRESSVLIAPIWIMIIFAFAMGIGTSLGGKKIIKSIGMELVSLENYEGFAADISSSIVLFISTLLGIPVSTTHTSTCSIMGVGASKRLSSVNWRFASEMILVWLLTFPCNLVMGYFFSKFIMIFIR